MPRNPPPTTRLEAFSDGVIAVIITIMVLEIKVPRQDGMAGLYAVIPILLIYLLSFLFTAVFWINHHHLVDRIETADNLTLYANLLFLFFLSLLPFSTAYVLEKKIDSFGVWLYATSMIGAALSFLLLRLAVHRTIRNSGSLEHEDRAELRKHLLSLAVYLSVFPLAYFFPRLAMALIALVTAAWIVPTLALRRDVRREKF